MAFELHDKVVLISGGAGDIGQHIVASFAKEKCRVILADSNYEMAQKVSDELSDYNVVPLQTDITNTTSISSAVAFVKEKYSYLDCLVNVAGILCRKSIFDTQIEDFELSMSVNVIGAFLLSREMVPLIRKSTSGSIINISSLNGSAAAENRVVYGATKAALNMVTKSMALELGEYGITVNAVAPGVVDSKMCRVRLNTDEKIKAFCHYIPLQRLTTPEDVSGSVLFLASPYSRGITGEILLVDGGVIARQALPR